ncbi:MAG: hypothetical protein WDM76_10305 [Limisphaerales bacterium]
MDSGRTSAPAHIVLQINNTNTAPSVGNNTALDFNGVDARVETTTSLPLGNRSFTLEAWASRPDPQSAGWIISQGQAAQNEGLVFGWTTNKFDFGFWEDDLQMSTPFYRHQLASLGGDVRRNQQDPENLPRWRFGRARRGHRHVAHVTRRTLHIGSQFGDAPFFHGGLKEIRVWDHVCTQEELQQTMTTPLDGTQDGLMLYYRLNEGNGLTVKDSSANSSYPSVPGYLSGGVSWANSPTTFGVVTVPRNVGPGLHCQPDLSARI